MKKFIIINLLLILLLSAFFNTTNAITVTDDSLSSSINKLNSSLSTVDPNYLLEIVDENGNVPSYEYYPDQIPSRSIKALEAFEGKIFMALGDWNNNTGPAKIIYYDTADGKIKSSGTIHDEAVQKFNIIDNKLYTTGCDPRDSWGYGNYYVYNSTENKWDKHINNGGWIHAFNIVEFKDKLYMCGSTLDTMQTSTIQVSADNGETFTSVPVFKNNKFLPYDSYLRCYDLIVFNNKLYGYISYPDWGGIYEYNENQNRFNYISDLPTVLGYTNSVEEYNRIFIEHEIFNGKFIYTGGKRLYTSTDLKTFTALSSFSKSVRDLLVSGDTLYLLSYTENSDDTYTAEIYSTKDLSKFNLVYSFITKIQPFALEYYDNSFYVGTGYPSVFENSEENGALYKITLNSVKNSLSIDTTNKKIQISNNIDSYNINYDLSTGNYVFKTNLNFNSTMSEEQCNKEYSKINDLVFLFSTVANSEKVDFHKSIYYYNDIISQKVGKFTNEFTTPAEYAKDMFASELDIQDSLFSLSSEKISESTDEYNTQVTLTIKSNTDFSSLKNTSSNNDSGATVPGGNFGPPHTFPSGSGNNNTTNNTINNTTNNTINTDNTNNNNTITNSTINNLINNNNSTVNDFIENNNKLPQTGRSFELKNLLQIILIVSIILIGILIIRDNKYKKAKKE